MMEFILKVQEVDKLILVREFSNSMQLKHTRLKTVNLQITSVMFHYLETFLKHLRVLMA